MLINHYIVLKLNATGFTDNGQPYTQRAIKEAYNRRARVLHPDHNPDVNANKDFENLTQSYEILRDIEKRKAFDVELTNNPSLIDADHLIVQLQDDESFKENPTPSFVNTEVSALVLYKPLGIDLTQLILNAECDSDHLLGFAEEEAVFAQALLRNSGIFSRFSTSQQFELLFILHQHSLTQRLSVDFMQESLAKFMLEGLRTRRAN